MSASKGPFHIPSLDGIRCVAVMTVLVAHAGLEKVVPGNLGVTVFFFLSGFLITTLMRLEQDKTGTVSLKLFYLRRVLRILPPFYLVLTLASAATVLGFLPGALKPLAVAAQALHVTNYWIVLHGWADGIAEGTWIFWSLAVEEHFYLVFPWLFFALQRLPQRRTQAFVLWGLCAAVLAWRLVLVFALLASHDRLYVATDTRFDSMLYGCGLALWGNPVLDETRLSERAWKHLLLPLGVVTLGASFLVRADWFAQTFRYSLQGVALIPLYVAAVRYPAWGPMRALNWKPVTQVGLISYSLYLVHPTLIEVVKLYGPDGRLVQGMLSVVLSLWVAGAIYVGVELPAGALRKKLSSHAKA